jgi:hypothetical protein
MNSPIPFQAVGCYRIENNFLKSFLSLGVNEEEATDLLMFGSAETLANRITYLGYLKTTPSDPAAMAWLDRARLLIYVWALVMVHDRENESPLLYVSKITDYLNLENIMMLTQGARVHRRIKQAVQDYLLSLPGYDANAKVQNASTLEQHGYLQTQLYYAVNF